MAAVRARDAQRVAARLRKDGFQARVLRDEDSSSSKRWVYFETGPWSVHVVRRTTRGEIRVIIDHDDLEVTVFFVRSAAEIAAAVKVAMVLAV